MLKGPFTVTWRQTTIENLEEIETNYDVARESVQTLDHRTINFEGARDFYVILTLAKVDVPIVGALVPQFFVPFNSQLSTGELVVDEDGAIDPVPSNCGEADYGDMLIKSCGDPGLVMRVVNARTDLEGFSFDQYRGTYQIRFIAEPEQGQPPFQLYREGGIVDPSS